MNILHFCLSGSFIDNFGYQENILAKFHSRMGHTVSVMTSTWTRTEDGKGFYTGKTADYTGENNIRIIRLNFKNNNKLSRVLKIFDGTQRYLDQIKPDFIFIHGIQSLDVSFILKYAKNYPNVKIVADNHADIYNSANSVLSRLVLHKIIWRKMAQKLLKYTKCFYGVLPARVDFLREYYRLPDEKLDLLVMGADDEFVKRYDTIENRRKVRETYAVDEDDFLIITGGKITKSKNVHLVMQAVRSLENKKIKLLIFGSVDDCIKPEIAELSNDERIKLAGFISSEKSYSYMLASDLAVFAGTHSVLWEQAVGCGLPCVFVKRGGMTHIDLNGNCIFLDKVSAEEIAKDINMLYNNREMYNEINKIAKEEGKIRFSYENAAKRVVM